MYGPGAATEGNLVGRLVGDHLAGRLPGVIGGEHTWSFSYVDDVVEAHVEALTRATAGDEFVIGGDNAPQMQAVRDRARAARPAAPAADSVRAARTRRGAFEEARARLTGRPPLLTRGVVEIFGHDWPLDGRPAADRLGYRMTPLAEGLRSVVGVRAGVRAGSDSDPDPRSDRALTPL